MAEIPGLGEFIEPAVTGISVENVGVGLEGVGGPGAGGLLDSGMSSLVSMAVALRRSTETVSSRPLRSIFKAS